MHIFPDPDPSDNANPPEEDFAAHRARRDEEQEFVSAMHRFKQVNRKPFPTWRDVLHVLRELGWSKEK